MPLRRMEGVAGCLSARGDPARSRRFRGPSASQPQTYEHPWARVSWLQLLEAFNSTTSLRTQLLSLRETAATDKTVGGKRHANCLLVGKYEGEARLENQDIDGTYLRDGVEWIQMALSREAEQPSAFPFVPDHLAVGETSEKAFMSRARNFSFVSETNASRSFSSLL